ncbi:MAG: ribose-phosphate diphosphokinase [Candidatus Bilamarchaeum sp.]|jgi:ribose-phosphate pyrophosphokinase
MYLISPNCQDLGKPNIEFKTFPDGDNYVRIENIKECQGEEVTLIHRLYPDQNGSIFNALLLLDTLNRVGARVNLVAPYLPYSRQDKTFLEGESLSAQVLCGLFAKAGVRKLTTIDCHFLKGEGEFEYSGLKIGNISANKLLVEHARKKVSLEPLEVISPDQGASYLVSEFGGKSMDKERGGYEKGEDAHRAVKKIDMDFEVEGKNILILDDMISTGGTMVKAIENVKKGGAKKIFAAATHGFFMKGSFDKLRLMCDGLFTTNTIANLAAEVDVKELIIR